MPVNSEWKESGVCWMHEITTVTLILRCAHACIAYHANS